MLVNDHDILLPIALCQLTRSVYKYLLTTCSNQVAQNKPLGWGGHFYVANKSHDSFSHSTTELNGPLVRY